MHKILPLLVLLACVGCAGEAPPTEPAGGAAEPPVAEAVAEAPPLPSAPEVSFRNARLPFEGRHLLTGGQPSSKELADLAAAGYRTIVNLRPLSEDDAWDEGPELEKLGVRYVNLPVAGGDGVTVENARRLAEIVDDDSAYPLVVHCASGNRVGALFAMKAFHLEGADVETALEIGRSSGLTRLEDTVRERLVRDEAPAE